MTIFTLKSDVSIELKPSEVSNSTDFSAALAPAVSGSKLMMACLVKRLSRPTCDSVKAVPEVAMTL